MPCGEPEVLQDEASDSDSAGNTAVDAIASEAVPDDNDPVGDNEMPQSRKLRSLLHRSKNRSVITEVPLPPRHGRALPQ